MVEEVEMGGMARGLKVSQDKPEEKRLIMADVIEEGENRV